MAGVRTLLRQLTDTDESSFVGKALRLPLRIVPHSSVLTVRDGVNKGAKWIAGSSLHSCWLGTYEADKQNLVARLVEHGMTVWDVGANAGFYTLAFSRLVGEGGRVYAFEPLAENADNILKHLELNNLTNTVLVQAALSGEDGLARFEPGPQNAEGRIVRNATPYLVPCFTIVSFLQHHPQAHPDLIKIDVEGAEADLLEASQEYLRESSPILILALHGQDVSRRCCHLLQELSYSLFNLDGSEATEFAVHRGEIFAMKGRIPLAARRDAA